MTRTKRFAHALMSGYVLLAVNMIYTLASVPLALKYLGKDEFGLWALATQVAAVVALVDFGLSASASRVLIDHKDHRASGGYGSIVQTGAIVGLTQGSLVVVVGLLVAIFIGPVLKVDAALQQDFKWLMIGYCVLVGLGFYTRIFTHMLTAHQRYDIPNYASAGMFALSFVVMWWCFERGLGIFSTLWGLSSGMLLAIGANVWACARMKLFPPRGAWGKPSWSAFRELFAFGRDYFLFAVGAQLISASQALLLTRFHGLETAAVWSICTRIYLGLSQLIFRIFDYSSAALAEMMVKGEKALLLRRFREILVLSCSLSVAAAVMLALCNSSFVMVWTSGKINSLAFFPTDIKGPAALARKLADQTDPVSRYLWNRLSTAQQSRIRALRVSDKGVDDLKTVLAAELNTIAGGQTIHEPGRFSGIKLSHETSELLGKDQGADGFLRSNRYLLEDAYPEDLANSRRAHWWPVNDLLLGIWLVLNVVIHAHTGLVGQTKRFLFMRYLTFFEGAAFIGFTVLFHRHGGISLMLATSIVCTCLFSLPYGLYRTRNYFGLRLEELAGWHRTIWVVGLMLAPAGLLFWWVTKDKPPIAQLTFNGLAAALFALWAILRFGLPSSLQGELSRRVPTRMKPALRILGL